MAYYTFEIDGNEVILEMSMAEREQYIKDNPTHKQLISSMNMIHDTGTLKVDNGWKSMLNRIRDNNAGSTIAKNAYGLGEV